MGWKLEEASKERAELQALAELKYDDYQQFIPGMRFMESFASWLYQFTPEERRIAFDFVRRRLIYVSYSEMSHLVDIAYPDIIQPVLVGLAARDLKQEPHRVRRITMSPAYAKLGRQSLFLGLSDGAHLDWFRRNNPHIVNEQVSLTYELEAKRAEKLQKKLQRDLEATFNDKDPAPRFRALFLLDDFTASGHSYFRRKGEGFDGKIHNVLTNLADTKTGLGSIVSKDVEICVILYSATSKALAHLRKELDAWSKAEGAGRHITVKAAQEFPEAVAVQAGTEAAFVELAKKYFDASIIDDNYRVGRTEHPHLGFDEGALPIVLFHNAPNNSFPLLWFGPELKHRGLFPRVRRHRGGL